MKLVLFLVSVVHLGWVYSTCTEFRTCGECIGYAQQRCAWCAQDSMESTQPNKKARCQLQTDVYKDGRIVTEWCPQTEVFNPGSKKYKPTENKQFSKENGSVVQFRPQKQSLTLRPGIPVTIDMYYRPAKDFPLDMYFLMDNSASMHKYSTKLAAEAVNIYEKLKQQTNNVFLGLGTFVEKHALPFADVFQRTSPFEHHLSLTNDINLFKKKVQNYHKLPGSNYDSPEATLDALMQVMVCGDKIGWRPSSRRIIIVATSAPFHSAGDGKLIGAYKPNDMKCHLDADNTFNLKASLTYDYPSVSIIDYVARQNNFRVVFAVDRFIKKTYDALQNQMYAVNSVALGDDKILTVIMEAYNASSHKLKLQRKNLPESITVKTDCDVNPMNCVITQGESSLHIQAEITALDCTEHTNFEINPFGLKDDKLSINITVNCKCECESKTSTLSDKCSNAGVLECGVCKCNPDRHGVSCECSDKDDSKLKDNTKCKKHPDDEVICSKHGECICGECKCHEGFFGNLCERDGARCRAECPADKGDCRFGNCVCKEMWKGPKCGCLATPMKCTGPFSKEVCSGRGHCNCGRCSCESRNDTKYWGAYCESCKDCPKELCENIKAYAICIYEKNNKTDCDDRHNHLSVKEAKLMDKKDLDAQLAATGCRKQVSNDNIIVYKYKVVPSTDTERARLELMVQQDLESPPVADIWITVGSIIGGILLVGLLSLIVWMIATSIYDRKAYDKFCKDATEAGFDVSNPTYIDPNVCVENPAFGLSDH